MDKLDNLSTVLGLIAVAGGLGTAAFGLVDASKAVWGGVSRAGFSFIRETVASVLGPRPAATPTFGHDQVIGTLRANWMNGMAKADQKATAKALIRLMLTPASVTNMANAVGVDATALATAVTHANTGTALTAADLAAIGAYDVKVSALLDFAYERGDQLYRNFAKLVAAILAIVLAVGAKRIVDGVLFDSRLVPALLLGLVATPLAPIAKDVSSSLQAAAKAVGALKR
jgi:hypothetical protein